MNEAAPRSSPPDQLQRAQALDPARSILVQAPAGSGKTTLLTERFLTLLGEVDDPGQIVAITFTTAAAAEMRNRILDELRKHEPSALAQRALDRSTARGWKLLDLPAQLRISTIDSFCRDLALQQPLLSDLGGGLAIAEQPDDLYRRAARSTLEQIGEPADRALSLAVEGLLKWRDNNWQELEDLLVDMLSKRDRWMHGFVLEREPDWDALRLRLEQPFANAVRDGLNQVNLLLDMVPGAGQEAQALARFACTQTGGELHRELAEIAEFPTAPFLTIEALEEAQGAFVCLAHLVLTNTSTLRKSIDKRLGFPSDRKPEKGRILNLIAGLAAVPGLESALAAVRNLPPARYAEDDWRIVRACFTLLRHAAAQLQVVFAEAAAVDFIQVAQIALGVLKGEEGFPSDAALAVADGIHHLLVDEFQDTSRRQHQLLAGLIAAWPDRTDRTCFAVGDPMQSIYFFREADAELFARVQKIGLEISNAEPLALDFVPLSANFRTTLALVDRLNEVFERLFAAGDGSGVTFSPAVPARDASPSGADPRFNLHLKFFPKPSLGKTASLWPNAASFPLHRNPHGVLIPPSVAFGKRARDNETQPSFANSDATEKETARAAQTAEIVELIRSHQPAMEEARAAGGKYRIAILARARKSLAPIAQALHEIGIPFRAVDLEKLAARPEILDALALARALINPQDRVAWLGVLRAPWCGLTLNDLHLLTSADDQALLGRPVPDLLAERLPLLSQSGRGAAERVLSAVALAPTLRAAQPTSSVGTWLEQIWLSLGGADCCGPTGRANLDLLWSCLDRLPGCEQDLLGPALDAALDKLTALPDPAASSDCGVQLMTIHKSKGLEFEVVIVPDLQAKTAGTSGKLLSWLERGLTAEAESGFENSNPGGEITEFLVAPLQFKGEDSGKSKAWVDRVYRDRESQETRRILYVAATRAREELHLFARPAYKVEANGDFSLVTPSASLLATAWPALEGEIRARFDEWKSTRLTSAGAAGQQSAAQATIESIAAAGEGNLVVMATDEPSIKPTILRRLPADYQYAPGAPSFPLLSAERVGNHDPQPANRSTESGSRLYSRHEGGLVSRALGTAVHAFIEEFARLRTMADWQAARASLRQFQPRIESQIRALGIAPSQAVQIAANAIQIALNASHDPTGNWIISPHPGAASEVRWTGVIAGALTNIRVDRIFRAGLTPQSEGLTAWWIIDYKTAHADNLDPAASLSQLRPFFAPQLEAYAKVLRSLHGADSVIRAGLYYPRMLLLDWWEL
jgi:ATP-dependent exoDNAse (exonuclease V) beta subunit